MNHTLRHHLISDRSSVPHLVDEHEGIDAVILFSGKAVRRRRGRERGRYRRMASRELLEFRRLGGFRRACGQRQKQVAELLATRYGEELEGIDHHVGIAAVRQVVLDRHTMRVCQVRSVRQVGYPVESEKRTVTAIVLPSNRLALLSVAAAGDALKLPSTTTPFA